ncbi:MAG: hydroxyisourate hydrolase [Opitutales bacterium]
MKNALTTHVLDTYHGRPAAAVQGQLLGSDGAVLQSFQTDANGRAGPLLEGDAFTPGTYALRFSAADYFRAQGVSLPDPPFLDVVTLDFGVADPATGYHVPLVLSPWSCATYRGS